MNQRPTLKDGTKNPLADIRVRQALNYAYNKQAIIQITSSASARRWSRSCPRRHRCRARSRSIRYDVSKAKSLLKEAGRNGFD